MFKQVLLGRKAERGFKAEAYESVAAAMTGESNGEYVPNGQSISNRCKHHKKKIYSIATEMLHASGFGFDNTTKRITASDDVWKAWLDGHPDAKPWKNNIIDYDMLTLIFGSDVATGQYARPATVAPSHQSSEGYTAGGGCLQVLAAGDFHGYTNLFVNIQWAFHTKDSDRSPQGCVHCSHSLLQAKESTPSSPQDFNPRSYQIEVYKAALMRNTIAVLETGAGKTMTAVMLMKEIRRLMKENGDKGLIIFLVPQHILLINSYIPNLSDAGQDHQRLLQRDNERNSWAPRQNSLGWHVSFLKSLA
ncbi:hypothetical protein AAC387_Pa01g2532 [Persea americana]